MSGMHMLPVYYTTTNTRRRKKKKKTKALLAAEKEHDKFLHQIGIYNSKQKSKGGRSSVGRASGLQPEGHRFEPVQLHHLAFRPEKFFISRFFLAQKLGKFFENLERSVY